MFSALTRCSRYISLSLLVSAVPDWSGGQDCRGIENCLCAVTAFPDSTAVSCLHATAAQSHPPPPRTQPRAPVVKMEELKELLSGRAPFLLVILLGVRSFVLSWSWKSKIHIFHPQSQMVETCKLSPEYSELRDALFLAPGAEGRKEEEAPDAGGGVAPVRPGLLVLPSDPVQPGRQPRREADQQRHHRPQHKQLKQFSWLL